MIARLCSILVLSLVAARRKATSRINGVDNSRGFTIARALCGDDN